MGGQGSGRPRNAEKHVIETYEAMNENTYGVFIPNLSGVQNEIKAGTHNITTDDLTEGSTNLYDQVVTITEGDGITLTGTYPDFTIATNDSEINHDDLNGFVANEHIDWTNATQNLTTTGNVSSNKIFVSSIYELEEEEGIDFYSGVSFHASLNTNYINPVSGSEIGVPADINLYTNDLKATDGTFSGHIEAQTGTFGDLRLIGYTSSTGMPTTTQLPTSKDMAIHKNTTSGTCYLAFNDGGTIRTVALT